ncbi:MAG: glycerol-3-phosphate dehydrogenase subunit GlpB [Halobacteriales archaeon]
MAALASARAGATVRLVSHKQSTLRQASGLVDVLGRVDGDTVADPFGALDSLPPDHPYRTVGAAGIREGLAAFEAAVGDAYRGGHTDRNALVPTSGGTVKPTARYPASVAAGLASDDRDALLVGFESVTDFDAPLSAAHLDAAGVPFAARGETVRFPADLRADATVTRYAALLDDEPVRADLARAVADRHDGEARIGFPALLGAEDPAAVRADLEARLDAAVFEVPTGPPSLPGMRLAERLDAALEAAGVLVETGNPVVGYDATGDRIERVLVERVNAAVSYRADAVVLATGGLVGGGVDSDRDGVFEPTFGLPVAHPEDRYEWAAEAPFGDHAFARFGVEFDGELRPLAADGAVAYENLRAAGAVLAGADFPAEKSGSGVSIATGVAAGRGAA